MSVRDFYKSHIDAIQTSYEYLEDEKVGKFIDLIMKCKGKILFTGIGKNGHVAAKATSTISSIGVPCFFIDAVDSVHGDMGVIDENDLLIAVSKSGNTDELVNFLHHVSHKNCRLYPFILIMVINLKNIHPLILICTLIKKQTI
jgi:arabinose-5-phosphate isomerase